MFVNNKTMRMQAEKDKPILQAYKQAKKQFRGSKNKIRQRKREKTVVLIVDDKDKVMQSKGGEGYSMRWLTNIKDVNDGTNVRELKETTKKTGSK